VTQVVFLILARKARRLREGTVLSGWLYRTARFASSNARQQEARRQNYEQQAALEMIQEMTDVTAPSADSDWQGLDPLLHDALDALSAADRDAVLLRFFAGKSLRETGDALNITEEAARKRVGRALEKMRRHFSERGVAVSAVLLATLLAANATKAAPSSCLATTLHATSAGAVQAVTAQTVGANVHALWQGATRAMLVNKVATSAGVVAAVGLTSAGAAKLLALSTDAPAPRPRTAQTVRGVDAASQRPAATPGSKTKTEPPTIKARPTPAGPTSTESGAPRFAQT
jgi:RNA polymerase sigma factor (sigma-70 family)